MRTIAGRWLLVREVLARLGVEAQDYGAEQYSFYCGAEAMLRLMSEAASAGLSEQACAALLKAWQEECRAYAVAWGVRHGVPREKAESIVGGEERGAHH